MTLSGSGDAASRLGSPDIVSGAEGHKTTLTLVVPARETGTARAINTHRPPNAPRNFHRNCHTRLTDEGRFGDPARWQDRRRRPLSFREMRAARRRLALGESPRRIANALGVRIGMVRWLSLGVRPVEVRDA